ncbi:MAG: AAA family ATPase [Gammaproteobacteria bacterium]|nr:AAA family ATPase [Gammaproteobacteria bacterium]
MDKEKSIFQGVNKKQPENLKKLGKTPAPAWREFRNKQNRKERGKKYKAGETEIEMVNAAFYLRRPLLITGRPGTGKSSLAHAVAYELDLGDVLVWPITSKSVLQDGLYSYDALARLQEAALQKYRRESGEIENPQDPAKRTGPHDFSLSETGRYIRLGPVGTAFLRTMPEKPCVILIDEIDKADIDLPNDLLHLFEEGEFEIEELARLPKEEGDEKAAVKVFASGTREMLPVQSSGVVRCEAFPLVIMTSNGEREFPPAFLRRCLRLNLEQPNEEKLREIVQEHLALAIPAPEETENLSEEKIEAGKLLEEFLTIRDKKHKEIATDQLLNAMYLVLHGVRLSDKEALRQAIFAALSDT